jgi:hypothetical protein
MREAGAPSTGKNLPLTTHRLRESFVVLMKRLRDSIMKYEIRSEFIQFS